MPLKTQQTKQSVGQYLKGVDEQKRKDTKTLIKIIKDITGYQPKLWGTIIGFGKYTYTRKGSKEPLEWFYVGVAPRKANISLYVTCYLEKEPLVKKLGCKHGKGCIYFKTLEDIDLDILKELITKYKDKTW